MDIFGMDAYRESEMRRLKTRNAVLEDACDTRQGVFDVMLARLVAYRRALAHADGLVEELISGIVGVDRFGNPA